MDPTSRAESRKAAGNEHYRNYAERGFLPAEDKKNFLRKVRNFGKAVTFFTSCAIFDLDLAFQAIQCYEEGLAEAEREVTLPQAKKPRKKSVKLGREKARIKTVMRALNKNLGLCYRLLGKVKLRSRSF